jgi:hypothetical protein
MPKRYDPGEKVFQPIEQALLKEVLDDSAPVAQVHPPTASPSARAERKVVPLELPPASPEPAHVTEPAERLNAPLKVHLQPGERRELNRLLNHLSQELGTSVSASHVQRALITLLQHAESEVLRRARDQAPMKRPPNGNLAAIAAFEFALAKILSGAFRETPPLRQSPRE